MNPAHAVRDGDRPVVEPEVRFGRWALAGALVAYLAAVAVATYPAVTRMTTDLPGAWIDPSVCFWLLRWYGSCLAEWRSPLFCPDVQYPAGAVVGNYAPLPLEAAFMLPLSAVLPSQVLRLNLFWLIGYLTTGMGTLLLCWRVLRHRGAAFLGGLLAMLSTPMLLHGQGHPELLQMGSFPLFMIAWLAWLDRPTWRRLTKAWLWYMVLALAASYYGILAAFPGALAVAWGAARAGRPGWIGWLRARAGGLVAFSAAGTAALAAVFACQVWAALQGVAMERPEWIFNIYGADWWGYLVPTRDQFLGRHLVGDAYTAAGYGLTTVERISYLGVVTIGLVAYAALRRVRFERSGYWWALLAMLVVLSLGATCRIGGVAVPMPAGWLRDWLPPIRLMRVPARANLFAGVIAALIAAAGARSLLGRLPGPRARGAVVAALAALAVADLGMAPFPMSRLPEMPPIYAELVADDPGATFLEVPQFHEASTPLSWGLNAVCGLWQSEHRGRTAAGYSANANHLYEDLAGRASPFADLRLATGGYLADPESVVVDLALAVPFRDYAWLYLTTHRFDYIVIHRWMTDPLAYYGPQVERLAELLRPALIHEDDRVAVYDCRRLPPPTGPVALPTEGWRGQPGIASVALLDSATVAVYRPSSSPAPRLSIVARSMGKPRTLSVRVGDREVARWDVADDEFRSYETPPLPLPAGRGALTIAYADQPEGAGAVRVLRLSMDGPTAGDRLASGGGSSAAGEAPHTDPVSSK